MKLSVSLGISPRQSLVGWVDLAVTLEQRGVDRIWLIDSQLAMKDVYVGLALAAAQTSRIELGTGVTNILTRHPTVTAGSIAAVAELAPTRVLLGLGAGDSAVYGLGWSPARIAAMEEASSFFRAVLAGESATWEGREYRLPFTSSPVPLYLAVSQRRMCELAGRVADGAIVMGPAQADFVQRQVGWIESGIRSAGRQRGDVEISLMTTLSARDNPADALNDVRSWASTEARLMADFAGLPPAFDRFRAEIRQARESYDYSQHLSTHAAHQTGVGDELTRTLAVAGTPEECASRLSELARTGVDSFIFPLLGGGRLARLDVLQRQVLPMVAATEV